MVFVSFYVVFLKKDSKSDTNFDFVVFYVWKNGEI
jgi:hypothetical protein